MEKKILVVDDEELIRNMLDEAFSNNGYHCCPVNFFEKQVNYMNLN